MRQEKKDLRCFPPKYNFSPSFSFIRAVSILVFMERPLQLVEVKVNVLKSWMFQSLFLWNDLFNLCQGIVRFILSKRFNPCFYGTTSSTLYDYRKKYSKKYVSILVFMERPLQQTW